MQQACEMERQFYRVCLHTEVLTVQGTSLQYKALEDVTPKKVSSMSKY